MRMPNVMSVAAFATVVLLTNQGAGGKVETSWVTAVVALLFTVVKVWEEVILWEPHMESWETLASRIFFD